MPCPPSSTLLRASPHEFDQLGEAATRRVCAHAELLRGHVHSIDPVSRVTKPLCARNIPAGKRHEENLLAGDLELLQPHSIRRGIWLVRGNPVGAQHMV